MEEKEENCVEVVFDWTILDCKAKFVNENGNKEFFG